MTTKKKLSTKPIKIEVPIQPTPVSSNLDSSWLHSSVQDSNQQEFSNLTVTLPDSTFLDSVQEETSKHIPYNQLEKQKQDSTFLDNHFLETSETLKPESRKPESVLQEYKKVAMRLSTESAERLRQFRGETGIPYEILVDVMVRNWDNLPQKTQNAYLKESQKVRAQRLIAGQEKAMLTTQKKYAPH